MNEHTDMEQDEPYQEGTSRVDACIVSYSLDADLSTCFVFVVCMTVTYLH